MERKTPAPTADCARESGTGREPAQGEITHEGTHDITQDAVTLLARLQGIAIPTEDAEALTRAFAAHLDSLTALEGLDLTDVEPVVHFDPRWA